MRPFLARPGAPAAHAPPVSGASLRLCLPAHSQLVAFRHASRLSSPHLSSHRLDADPETGGGVRRFALPTGRGYAPHRNRHAGACLNPARGLRLAAGRGHPFGVVGRIFSAAPPGRPLPTLRPRVRGARRAPGMSDAALGRLHPPQAVGPVPTSDPLARSRAAMGPRRGEAAPPPTRLSARGRPLGFAPPKAQRTPSACVALVGS